MSTVLPASPPLTALKTTSGSTPQCVGEDQRFAHGCDVTCHHDLVGELGDIARTDRAGQRNARAHELKDGHHVVEHLLIAADHDGERAVDGFRLAAANGRIQKPTSFSLHTLRRISAKQWG